MSLIQLKNINKFFREENLLENINFNINRQDKIGLVGLNGSGKTTLMKIMLGIESYDNSLENNKNSEIIKMNNIKIGYLSQGFEFENEENSIFNEILYTFKEISDIWKRIEEKNYEISLDPSNKKYIRDLGELNDIFEKCDGYNTEYKIKEVLSGVGLKEKQNDTIKKLSGGEKSRAALAKILLVNPDLLVLDEPTNHLDVSSIEWLENYLKKYKKAVLMVSHDRYFLDNICNRIFEIENKSLKIYVGNFSDFILQKELIKRGKIKEYEKSVVKEKKLKEFILKYKAGVKSKQARGREKLLEKMEKLENPKFKDKKMSLSFKISKEPSDLVVSANKINKIFRGKSVLNNISFNLYKKEKIGIIGENGIGKTTLLKIINKSVKQDMGEIKLGNNVIMSYFDQNFSKLDERKSIFEEINTSFEYNEEQIRTIAGSFLFTGEEIYKKISNLSGGEKVRVAFLKMSLNKGNFLLLDEPTNHLDIYSKEVLEEALCDYEGTILAVSHDRQFLDNICTKIYHLSQDGITTYKGNYKEYKESLTKKTTVKSDKKEQELNYKKNKKQNQYFEKLKRDMKKIEKEIEKIEENILEIEKELYKKPSENSIDKVIELNKAYEEEKNNLEEKYKIWGKLNDDYEKL